MKVEINLIVLYCPPLHLFPTSSVPNIRPNNVSLFLTPPTQCIPLPSFLPYDIISLTEMGARLLE